MEPLTETFERERPRLRGIAYRMLGSRADADDVLQDAWLRWNRQRLDELQSPQAWLTTTVMRLAIDRLRAAKVEREHYSGPWLPEPVEAQEMATPASHAELASDLSIAFLTVLERLAPEERAAFLMHEAFDYDYEEIAEVLGKTLVATRQIVYRARERVHGDRARFAVSEADRIRVLQKFSAAAASGNREALIALFAEEATMTSDGGGKAVAVLRILRGAERIVRLWLAFARRKDVKVERRLIRVNGEPGLAVYIHDRLHSVAAIDTDGQRIFAYYGIANPDKLAGRDFSEIAVTDSEVASSES
jgi:RNA polymerase sigma-70 factor (ECF subfamily)